MCTYFFCDIYIIMKVPYGQDSINIQQIQFILRQHQRPQATSSTSEVTPPPTDGLHELLSACARVSRVKESSPSLLNQLKQLCSQIQTYLSQNSWMHYCMYAHIQVFATCYIAPHLSQWKNILFPWSWFGTLISHTFANVWPKNGLDFFFF